jgi:hypothetical protein
MVGSAVVSFGHRAETLEQRTADREQADQVSAEGASWRSSRFHEPASHHQPAPLARGQVMGWLDELHEHGAKQEETFMRTLIFAIVVVVGSVVCFPAMAQQKHAAASSTRHRSPGKGEAITWTTGRGRPRASRHLAAAELQLQIERSGNR